MKKSKTHAKEKKFKLTTKQREMRYMKPWQTFFSNQVGRDI